MHGSIRKIAKTSSSDCTPTNGSDERTGGKGCMNMSTNLSEPILHPLEAKVSNILV